MAFLPHWINFTFKSTPNILLLNIFLWNGGRMRAQCCKHLLVPFFVEYFLSFTLALIFGSMQSLFIISTQELNLLKRDWTRCSVWDGCFYRLAIMSVNESWHSTRLRPRTWSSLVSRKWWTVLAQLSSQFGYYSFCKVSSVLEFLIRNSFPIGPIYTVLHLLPNYYRTPCPGTLFYKLYLGWLPMWP